MDTKNHRWEICRLINRLIDSRWDKIRRDPDNHWRSDVEVDVDVDVVGDNCSVDIVDSVDSMDNYDRSDLDQRVACHSSDVFSSLVLDDIRTVA